MNCHDENRMPNIALQDREQGDGRGEVRCPFPSWATLGSRAGELCFRSEEPEQAELVGGPPPLSQG